MMGSRRVWLGIGLLLFFGFVLFGALAPEYVSSPVLDQADRGFFEAPPFGTDERGIPLHEYAMQGASIVALPALLGSAVVMFLATLAGLVRCAEIRWLDTMFQVAGELIGSVPRMVVLLVVALGLPYDWRVLTPVAVVWAILAAPTAMDEAAASAGRLGGTRFVEALRAHGFSAIRVYLYHVVWMNLRPVIVRQGAEVGMQIVFLEIALSYLAIASDEPSFTHPESSNSWATLLYQGYTWVLTSSDALTSSSIEQSVVGYALDAPLLQSMLLSLLLVGLTALCVQSFRFAARAR